MVRPKLKKITVPNHAHRRCLAGICCHASGSEGSLRRRRCDSSLASLDLDWLADLHPAVAGFSVVQAMPGFRPACFFFRLLLVNSCGAVVDAITPGEKVGGEVARVLQLRKYLGYSTGQATILVTIQKAMSLSALVLLNLAVILTMANHVAFLQVWPVRLLVLLLLITIGVFLFSSYSEPMPLV